MEKNERQQCPRCYGWETQYRRVSPEGKPIWRCRACQRTWVQGGTRLMPTRARPGDCPACIRCGSQKTHVRTMMPRAIYFCTACKRTWTAGAAYHLGLRQLVPCRRCGNSFLWTTDHRVYCGVVCSQAAMGAMAAKRHRSSRGRVRRAVHNRQLLAVTGRAGFARRCPADQWSLEWPQCLDCGTTERPHMARGLCQRCYRRMHKRITDYWRREQAWAATFLLLQRFTPGD